MKADYRVLIVEDELIIAQATRLRLERHGFTVGPLAATGLEAVRYAEEFAPRVVLMDVKLRGDLDGIDTADIICSRMPARIIYLTGNSELKTDQRLIATQPVGILVKPPSEHALISMLKLACGAE